MDFYGFREALCAGAIALGLPVTALYHTVCSNAFLNVSATDATGLEKAGNVCLLPVRYLLAGKLARPVFSGEGYPIGYRSEQEFAYDDDMFWWRTAAAYCALPSSLVAGSVLKGLSLLSYNNPSRKDMLSVTAKEGATFLSPHDEYYRSIGIEMTTIDRAEAIISQGYPRRPEDIRKLRAEKEALREITSILHEEGIVYWLDCGTCLGAYRHGGNIPWDWDLDMAILQNDFGNVRKLLSSRLDPEKYAVQDWSSRDKEESYLKVYVRETGCLIDIYHFRIDPGSRSLRWVLSNVDCAFLPESWKVRERSYVVDTPFEYVFPLKKANFDGVEAFVPRETEKYLQQRYGENIGPAKIYNPDTGEYEKDPTHPYWNRACAR